MKKLAKMFTSFVAAALIIVSSSIPAFAAEQVPAARMNGNNTVTFSNLDSIAVNETVELDIVDSNGQPATIGLQRLPNSARSTTQGWKVWYTGISINAHFYMDITNNKVTSVYDDWILVIGGTFSGDSLTKTSTTGKLTFNVDAYAGILGAKCWLKGTVTGSNNDVNVSWQM